jgi:hypothetical protein
MEVRTQQIIEGTISSRPSVSAGETGQALLPADRHRTFRHNARNDRLNDSFAEVMPLFT